MPAEYTRVELPTLLQALGAGTEPVALDTETTGLDVRPGGRDQARYLGCWSPGWPRVLILGGPGQNLRALPELQQALGHRVLLGHNIRFDLHALGVSPVGIIDTMGAAYYANTTSRKSLDHLTVLNGWAKVQTPQGILDGRIDEMSPGEVCDYLADDVLACARLWFRGRVPRYPDLDRELELAVLHMERRGLALDKARLSRIRERVLENLERAAGRLRGHGYSGDLGSTRQVGDWLVSQGRDLPRTPKDTGWSTDTLSVLAPLAAAGDAVVGDLIEWRQARKLLDSFLDTLPGHVRATGLLHPEVRTTKGGDPGGTSTRRLAYANPNLQQIPKRTDLGRQIRLAFGAPFGGPVTGADYSQIELRVAALLSGEPGLLLPYAAGADVHREVAARIRGVSPAQITEGERFMAKAVNFGALNWMGARRLAIELRKARPEWNEHRAVYEAHKFLDGYWRALPRLRAWMDETAARCEEDRIARTIAGATRSYGSQARNTHTAVSVAVQGSAAELIRAAMVSLHRDGVRLLLSVHDEILVDGTVPDLGARMQAAAEAAWEQFTGIRPCIPLPATGGTGPSWGELV